MVTQRSRRSMAVTGTVLLVTVVTTGCGRNPIRTDAVQATPGASISTPTTAALEPVGAGAAVPAQPVASPDGRPQAVTGAPAAAPSQSANPILPAPPAPSSPAPPPPPSSPASPTPLATPDLTGVQQLLRDLDAALGAEATADTDEGSAP